MLFKKWTALFLSLLLLFISASLCFADEAPADTSPTATPAAQPKGYVLVTTSNMQGLLPLPLEEDYTYDLMQTGDDGLQVHNIIHLMPDGFYVESADCDNQECVGEGIVTFENRDSRILGNAVFCLPHQVALELYTYEELLELTGAEE